MILDLIDACSDMIEDVGESVYTGRISGGRNTFDGNPTTHHQNEKGLQA